MNKQVWISLLPNWWRRTNPSKKCNIYKQSKEEAIKKAKEIVKRCKCNKKYTMFYWRNPHPPKV